MKSKTSRRLIRRLGLALAVAALAAPAAQAVPFTSDEGAGPAPSQMLFAGDLSPVSSGPTDSLGRPVTPSEPTDSLGRPLGQQNLVQPTSDVVSDSSRFDWTHVGIGFFALGLMLLGGGALIIGRQNRRSRLAAT